MRRHQLSVAVGFLRCRRRSSRRSSIIMRLRRHYRRLMGQALLQRRQTLVLVLRMAPLHRHHPLLQPPIRVQM